MNKDYFIVTEGKFQYVYVVSGIENFKLYKQLLNDLGFSSVGYTVNFSDKSCFVFSRRVA